MQRLNVEYRTPMTQPEVEDKFSVLKAELEEESSKIPATETYVEDWKTDPVFDKIADDVGDATTSLEQVNDKLLAATPESQSNPQLSWPETSIADTPTEAEIHGRYNYRLTTLGFILDAVRPYLDKGDVDTWLKFKHDISNAKTTSDFHDKFDKLDALEEDVHKFKTGFNVTEADFAAAMNL